MHYVARKGTHKLGIIVPKKELEKAFIYIVYVSFFWCLCVCVCVCVSERECVKESVSE